MSKVIERSRTMQKIRSHFEISEWPLVILTLFIVVMINNLV